MCKIRLASARVANGAMKLGYPSSCTWVSRTSDSSVVERRKARHD